LRRCPPIIGKLSNAVRRSGERLFKAVARTLVLAIKARLLDRLVLTSSSFAPDVKSRLGAREAQLAVVPNPALDGPPVLAVSEAKSITLIAAGRLEPQKNFALLLRALALLPEDVDLTILGSGPLEGELRALASDLGLSKRVVFAGYVSETAEWFGRARLFVLSSDYEGFCTVVVETLAAGLPVVATDCSPSIREFLDMPAKGRVVPTGRHDLLAAAIAEQLRSPLADSKAMQSTAGKFMLSTVGSEYLRLFDEVQTG
jgi:glycosyltransferase involved in cell wall biosynthesis